MFIFAFTFILLLALFIHSDYVILAFHLKPQQRRNFCCLY